MVNVEFQLFQPNYLNIKSPPRKVPWLWPHTLYLKKLRMASTVLFLEEPRQRMIPRYQVIRQATAWYMMNTSQITGILLCS
jgi:hypothetical protein